MTAQLLEYTPESASVVRRVQAARSASPVAASGRRPATFRAEERWAGSRARACDVSRPSGPRVAASASRLEWTPRGIAVMVLLVALLAGVMLATLVGAFLSVSNEPLEAGTPSVAVALAAVQPGR